MLHRYQVRIHARMPEFWKAEDLDRQVPRKPRLVGWELHMDRREVPLLWDIALRNRHCGVLQNLLGREETREITKV